MSLFRIANEIVVRRHYFDPLEGFPDEDMMYDTNLKSDDTESNHQSEVGGDYRISAPRHNFGGQILWAHGEEHR